MNQFSISVKKKPFYKKIGGCVRNKRLNFLHLLNLANLGASFLQNSYSSIIYFSSIRADSILSQLLPILITSWIGYSLRAFTEIDRFSSLSSLPLFFASRVASWCSPKLSTHVSFGMIFLAARGDIKEFYDRIILS